MRLTLLIAVLICIARAFIPSTHVSVSGSYQAFAHLFVGGLIGGAIVTRNPEKRGRLIWIAVCMSVVEIAAAIVTRL